jgi:Ca2+-binding RTX toxin-like protein
MEYVTRTKKGKGLKMGKSSWKGNKAITWRFSSQWKRSGVEASADNEIYMRDGVINNDFVQGSTGVDQCPTAPDPALSYEDLTVTMTIQEMIVTANGAPSELPGLADADPFASPTITGTTGTNNIQGTAGADVIDARQGGNDRIFGRGGNDIICAGPGFDRIYGDSGDDTAVNSIDNLVGNDDVDGGIGF